MDVLNQHPGPIFILLLTMSTNLLARAHPIPAIAPTLTGWPSLLLAYLLGDAVSPYSCPLTVVNAQTGHTRQSFNQPLQHLLQSQVYGTSTPRVGGLSVTILYLSRAPSAAPLLSDRVACAGFATVLAQLALATLAARHGVASDRVCVLMAADALASLCVWALARRALRRDLCAARPVAPGTREVVCLMDGRGAGAALVVFSDAGALRLGDVAGQYTFRRAGGAWSAVAVAVVMVFQCTLGWGVFWLDAADAWCLLALCALGVAHAAYAARAWRAPEALGFEKCTVKGLKKRVVQADNVMDALMEVEGVERGVGLALLPVLLTRPMDRHEESWWAERQTLVDWTRGVKKPKNVWNSKKRADVQH